MSRFVLRQAGADRAPALRANERAREGCRQGSYEAARCAAIPRSMRCKVAVCQYMEIVVKPPLYWFAGFNGGIAERSCAPRSDSSGRYVEARCRLDIVVLLPQGRVSPGSSSWSRAAPLSRRHSAAFVIFAACLATIGVSPKRSTTSPCSWRRSGQREMLHADQERHSPSSLNQFAASPAMFVLERILGLRQPVGVPAHRGVAIEDGVALWADASRRLAGGLPLQRRSHQVRHHHRDVVGRSPARSTCASITDMENFRR